MTLFYPVKRLIILLICFFCSVVISGCTDHDMSDLTKYIRTIKAKPKQAIEPLPEQKIVETFVFNPKGLRDPFGLIKRADEEQVLAAVVGNGLKPDFTRRKEELELYSLDSLRMVGTLTMNASFWGLVKASDGTIHRIQVGNYMGKNYGKIIRITENQVELTEIVPGNQKGLWQEHQASLALTE